MFGASVEYGGNPAFEVHDFGGPGVELAVAPVVEVCAVDEVLLFSAGDSESRDSRSLAISTTVVFGLARDSPALARRRKGWGS